MIGKGLDQGVESVNLMGILSDTGSREHAPLGASHFKLVTFTSAQVGIIHPALTGRESAVHLHGASGGGRQGLRWGRLPNTGGAVSGDHAGLGAPDAVLRLSTGDPQGGLHHPAIESLNYSLRKIIQGQGAFPHDDAIRKLLYHGLKNVSKNGRCRSGTGRLR